MLSAGTEVVQMARPTQDSRADVLVEITVEARDDEAHSNDRLLNPKRAAPGRIEPNEKKTSPPEAPIASAARERNTRAPSTV